MENSFTITIPAIRLDQSIEGIVSRPDAYVFQMKASDLLKFTTVSRRLTEDGNEHTEEGFQRLLKNKRCGEINEFVRKDYGFLPNNLILNFPEKTLNFIHKDNNEGELRIDFRLNPDKAFIIDGQHRLYAFSKEYNKDNIDIPFAVTAYHGLSDNDMALIFRSINEKQQKIPKSLILDLLPKAKFADDDEATIRAQEIAEILNKTKREIERDGYDYEPSALSQRFYVDGRRNSKAQPINFGAAVSIFAKNYLDASDRQIFTRNGLNQNHPEQVRLLINCVNSFRDYIGQQFWLTNKDSVFTHSLGITALLEDIPHIIAHIKLKNKDCLVPDTDIFKETYNNLFPNIENDKKDIFYVKNYDKKKFRESVNKLKKAINDRIDACER